MNKKVWRNFALKFNFLTVLETFPPLPAQTMLIFSISKTTKVTTPTVYTIFNFCDLEGGGGTELTVDSSEIQEKG